MPDEDSDSDDGGLFEVPRRTALYGLGGLAAGVGIGAGVTQTSNAQRATDGTPPDTAEDSGGRSSVSTRLAETLPGDKFGKVGIGPYAHSLQMSGTRRPAWMIQPFNERTEVSGNEYEDVGSNIGYGTIPFPPGHVPVLRVVGHFEGDDETTTSLRVSIANIPGRTTESGDFVPLDRDQDPRQTIVELTGQGTTQVYEEAYLTEFEDVVAGGAGGGTNGTEYPINTFIIEAKTGSVSGSSFVTDATTVSLELEAL